MDPGESINRAKKNINIITALSAAVLYSMRRIMIIIIQYRPPLLFMSYDVSWFNLRLP